MKYLSKCKTSHVQNKGMMVLFTCLLFSSYSFSQATSSDPLNLPSGGIPNFLGWDPSVNSDVLIRHRTENQAIIFSTDGVDRMGITADDRILINTPNANSARMSVANARGEGAVAVRVGNNDGNSINRALRVAVFGLSSNPTFGIHTEVTGSSSNPDNALRAEA